MPAIGHANFIRPATDEDRDVIERIASLDSSRPIEGAALIGEIDGVPAAVLSLATGRVVANPFRRTADLVADMRTRASSLTVAEQQSSLARRLRVALRRPSSAHAAV
jgi:hypothetical protein